MTKFCYTGPFTVEKALPNNNYLVRKDPTDETQVFQRMRQQPFTPRKPIPDEQTTSQECKPDPEVTNKQHDLYARALESDSRKFNSNNDHDRQSQPNPPEVTLESNRTDAKLCSIPETPREGSQEIPSPTERICVGTDTYPYMESDAKMSSEQPKSNPTNFCSTKHDLRYNLKPNGNDDYKY